MEDSEVDEVKNIGTPRRESLHDFATADWRLEIGERGGAPVYSSLPVDNPDSLDWEGEKMDLLYKNGLSPVLLLLFQSRLP